MILLKIVVLLLGMAFFYLDISFILRKKYTLINGFMADYKAGRKEEAYAKRVGMVEFVIGIVILAVGIAFLFLL